MLSLTTQIKSDLSEQYKLIWTNPNDENLFNPQTITLNESGTIFLLDVTVDNAISYSDRVHVFIPVMVIPSTICLFGTRYTDNIYGKRNLVITSTQSQTSFAFSNAFTSNDVTEPHNNWMRPHAIYKVK